MSITIFRVYRRELTSMLAFQTRRPVRENTTHGTQISEATTTAVSNPSRCHDNTTAASVAAKRISASPLPKTA